MELRVKITKKDIKRLQKEYAKACDNKQCRPRLSERDWIAREILRGLPSGATSQKGQWAVDATFRPFVEEALSKTYKPSAREKQEEKKRQVKLEERRVKEEKLPPPTLEAPTTPRFNEQLKQFNQHYRVGEAA